MYNVWHVDFAATNSNLMQISSLYLVVEQSFRPNDFSEDVFANMSVNCA